jgi:hypothetical protein
VRSLLRVAFEVGYLEKAIYESIKAEVMKLSAYMFNHIKAIKQSPA